MHNNSNAQATVKPRPRSWQQDQHVAVKRICRETFPSNERVKERTMDTWIKTVKNWFPQLDSKPYVVPAVHFNRVVSSSHSVGDVTVKVQQPIPQLSDVREQEARQRVHHALSHFFRQQPDPVFVLFGLDFDSYLNYPKTSGNNLTKKRFHTQLRNASADIDLDLPVNETDNTMFIRPRDLESEHRRGSFDVLIIHKKYGLIVCEIKAIGDLLASSFLSSSDNKHAVIQKKVLKSLLQLNKEEHVLHRLTGDLSMTQPIRKALVLPNLNKATLQEVLEQDHSLQQEFYKCFKSDWQTSLKNCIFSDQLPPVGKAWEVHDEVLRSLDDWWGSLICGDGQPLDDHLYHSLVARFCGPGTTQLVQTSTQKRADIKTLHNAVLHTTRCMEDTVLNASQLQVLEKEEDNVMLTGPPGTGKSLLLALRAVQWLQAGHHVVLLSLWDGSEAASRHVLHTIKTLDASLAHRVKLLYSNHSDLLLLLDQLETAALGKDSHVQIHDMDGLYHGSRDQSHHPALLRAVSRRFTEPTTVNGHIHSLDMDTETDNVCFNRHRDRASPKFNQHTGTQHSIPLTPTPNGTAMIGRPQSPGSVKPSARYLTGSGAQPAPGSPKYMDIRVIVDEAPWFFPLFVELLEQRLGHVHIWAATSFPAARNTSLREVVLTQSMRCPPVVVREMVRGAAYTTRAMPRYMPRDIGVLSSVPPPTDGPPVKTIRHNQHHDVENDVWQCSQCAAQVAAFLTEELGIGRQSAHHHSQEDVLKFKDVLISGYVTLPSDLSAAETGSSDIHCASTYFTASLGRDDRDYSEYNRDYRVGQHWCGHPSTDTASAKLPGFLHGLQQHGIPFHVARARDRQGTDRHAAPDSVYVAEPKNVLGLERPVVVVIGTNDVRETYPRYADPWFDVIACCTAQLVVVEGVQTSLEDLVRQKLALTSRVQSERRILRATLGMKH